MQEPNDHWLVRPKTIRALWITAVFVLAFLVLLDLIVPHHPQFDLDGLFGFHSGIGFIACVALVLVSKLLGYFLKRQDTFYDE